MNKFALALTTILVFVIVADPSRVAIPQDKAATVDNMQPMTIRGAIWDSTCAASGSHGKVIGKGQAKDAKDCTLLCVKGGAQFVLYNLDDKTTFRLDSQDKVKEYAGQLVMVTGKYERDTGILHVDRIDAVM